MGAHVLWPILVRGDILGQERLRTHTSNDSRAQATFRLWGRVAAPREADRFRERDNCVCTQSVVFTVPLLQDGALLFRGCGVVEPAVLSIDCYFEPHADGTAASLRDEAVGNLPLLGRKASGAGGYLACFFYCMWLASRGLWQQGSNNTKNYWKESFCGFSLAHVHTPFAQQVLMFVCVISKVDSSTSTHQRLLNPD